MFKKRTSPEPTDDDETSGSSNLVEERNDVEYGNVVPTSTSKGGNNRRGELMSTSSSAQDGAKYAEVTSPSTTVDTTDSDDEPDKKRMKYTENETSAEGSFKEESDSEAIIKVETQGPLQVSFSFIEKSCSELQTRWRSDDYKNYLKVLEALLCLRDALCPFTKHVLLKFQSEMMTKHSITQEECKNKTCNAKHIKGGKLQPECPDICSKLLVEILNAHRSCNSPKNIYWENATISRWSVDEWEIAKVYMGRGQKQDNTGPLKSDSSAILQLLTNCKIFWKYLSCGDVDKLLHKRNEAMHSATFTFSHEEMKETLTVIMDFLRKLLNSLSVETDISASIKNEMEQTVNKLKELMDVEIEVFLRNNEKSSQDEEVKILHEIIIDHERQLNCLEDVAEKVQAVKTIVPPLETITQKNDLMGDSQDCFQNLLSPSQLKNRILALTKITEGTESRMTDTEKDVVNFQSRVGALTSKSDKNRSQDINFKRQLKKFLDSKKIQVPPKYEPYPDPTIDDKWRARVTIVVGCDAKIFECLQSCQKIVDAEQSAASEAYNFLLKHEELYSGNDTLDKGLDPQEKLDEMLLSFGFQKATYNITENVTDFKATVTVNISGIIQKKLNNVTTMKHSDKLQAVATEALSAIGQNAAGNSQNVLYGWCGRNGYSSPTYYPECAAETTNYICAISNAFKENLNCEVESIWFQSEKEAIQAAAEVLLTIIKNTKLEDIWSSQGRFKPVILNL